MCRIHCPGHSAHHWWEECVHADRHWWLLLGHVLRFYRDSLFVYVMFLRDALKSFAKWDEWAYFGTSPFSTLVVQPTASNNMMVILVAADVACGNVCSWLLHRCRTCYDLGCFEYLPGHHPAFLVHTSTAWGQTRLTLQACCFHSSKKSTMICSPSRCCILQCN